MAEYLIQDTTLDAIADAINAKTGGEPVSMTPSQMVVGISEIAGGWELVAEATASEDVSVLQANIPSVKQQMAAYLAVFDCTVLAGTATGPLYGCPRINSINVGQPYALSGAANAYTCGVARGRDGFYRMILTNSNNVGAGSSSVEYVAFVGYYAENLIAAGSTIKVYGMWGVS